MKRYITGGELGDAVMSYCKLMALDDKDFFLHHCMTHVVLKDHIHNFYKSQGIKHEITLHEDVDRYVLNHIKDYDSYLGTSWDAKGCLLQSWEINPSPPIKYDHMQGIDVALFPSSGRSLSRRFDFGDIRLFADRIGRDLHYLGIDDEDHEQFFNELPGISLINMTPDIKQVVDIVCSANVVIAQGGFACYIAAAAGKDLYMVPEPTATVKRMHPSWKVKYIKNLTEVDL